MDVEVDSLDVVEASGRSVEVLLWSLAALAAVYVVVMQALYGTLSLSRASRTWKRGGGDEERYENLFSQRESLRYHIGWAKSRGDHDEARSLLAQLKQLDQQLDELEERMRKNSHKRD